MMIKSRARLVPSLRLSNKTYLRMRALPLSLRYSACAGRLLHVVSRLDVGSPVPLPRRQVVQKAMPPSIRLAILPLNPFIRHIPLVIQRHETGPHHQSRLLESHFEISWLLTARDLENDVMGLGDCIAHAVCGSHYNTPLHLGKNLAGAQRKTRATLDS